MNDHAVEEEDQKERKCGDHGEYDPRSDVLQEEVVLGLRAADSAELAGARVLGSSRPELVEVLRQRQEDDHAGRQDGATPATDALFTERETDGDEPAPITSLAGRLELL